MATSSVRTQIIGAAGEALVTYKLLKHEIGGGHAVENAPGMRKYRVAYETEPADYGRPSGVEPGRSPRRLAIT